MISRFGPRHVRFGVLQMLPARSRLPRVSYNMLNFSHKLPFTPTEKSPMAQMEEK